MLFKKANAASTVQASVHSRLIALQDWDAVRKVLSSERGQEEIRAEMSSLGVDCALHFACRFHPPLDVVMSIAGVFPGSVTQSDKAGRYPLHIAAKWGASPLVIRYLIDEQPSTAKIQDGMGKTALHHACESYARNYSSRKNEGRPLKQSLLEVVKRLCKAAPSSVNLEDDEDMTAIEYAIEADVDVKIVRSVQKASEKDWKERRSQTPGTKHEAVERNLLLESQRNSQRLTKYLLEMTQSAMYASMSSLKNGETKMPGICQLPITVRPRKANSLMAFTA